MESGDKLRGYERAACIHANNSLPSVTLHRRYPVMWQGHLTLKNDLAAVQLHFLSGNVNLAKLSLPQQSDQRTPALRISQRMRLEQTQLEGVDRRMQVCVCVVCVCVCVCVCVYVCMSVCYMYTYGLENMLARQVHVHVYESHL